MSTLTVRPGGRAATSPAVTAGAEDATAWLVHRLVSVALLTLVPVLVITADVLADGPLRHLDELLSG